MTRKTLTLKIVYYGCAKSGKTTNLVSLHRLTDPDGNHGMVSIATKDDRTLFFDLLPMNLGQVAGLEVKLQVYTVPGQVHYELTRRQVLAGADGVVLVIDSDPEQLKSNQWGIENLNFNLKANKMDPETIPRVMQWNKRDLATAMPVNELEAELNPRKFASFESVATTGCGVLDTFGMIVRKSIKASFNKTDNGQKITEKAIGVVVERALADARARQPNLPKTALSKRTTFEHTVDMEAYQDRWAASGRHKQILDQESLLAESVTSNMKMAESLEGYTRAQVLNQRRARMMVTMGRLAPMLKDPEGRPLPHNLLSALMQSCARENGSILMYQAGSDTMEERELVGLKTDPLNAILTHGQGSAAYRICKTRKIKEIKDLKAEVFFESVPPGSEELDSARILPLTCDGAIFGAIVLYLKGRDEAIDDAEADFWNTTASLLSLSLHWRALRRKIAETRKAS